MRVRTLEIRWHDNKPICTCDFQPVSYKKARPTNERDFTSQSYRLATGGEDNNVRLWMVHPNIMPPSVASSTTTPAPARPPRVEYLATLSRHSAPVNVVRFSPNGELIASAGDDGMIIIWAQTTAPQAAAFGSDITTEELQYEKEYWKARTPFRCATMQVYDLAWSPTGEYIIAGSTDNTARIFSAQDGSCVREIAEHSHFVQGVAWDPLNEYIATQSSDRSVHVYKISTKQGNFEAHAVGKNSRMTIRHTRTPSTGTRPRTLRRRQSAASDTESAITTLSDHNQKEEKSETAAPIPSSSSSTSHYAAPPTPASVASTPSASVFLPPPIERSISRRSSISSNAPGSPPPPQYSHFGRSPSPMPPLPAIRAPPSPMSIVNTRLYGDESFANFFRRLTFSPDGGMLLTPAGHFEDPSVIPGNSGWGETTRGRRGHPSDVHSGNSSGSGDEASSSSVFIYTRANFARPPIAQLPGHKKASVAVKFSPILYDLRPGVVGAETSEPKSVVVERGKDSEVKVDLTGPTPAKPTDEQEPPTPSSSSSRKLPESMPAPSPSSSQPPQSLPSPALSAADSYPPPTPVSSTPAPVVPTGSVFALPYRMLFAVATMDSITIHDTQQSSPICLLTKLHYDEFTDMSWSPDGQCLMLTSRDGYCTVVVFDEILQPHHTQQQALQVQSIAMAHHLLPTPTAPSSSHHSSSSSIHQASASPLVTPQASPRKRSEPPGMRASSSSDSVNVRGLEGVAEASGRRAGPNESNDALEEQPKKKRRVALTHIGGLDS